MRCSHCGNESPAGAPFCTTCGHPLTPPPSPPAIPHGGTARLAVAGFVLSFFCGVVGLVLSIMAYHDVRQSQGHLSGEGLATAGMVISVVNMVIGVMVALSR
jgi:hypothetical protein